MKSRANDEKFNDTFGLTKVGEGIWGRVGDAVQPDESLLIYDDETPTGLLRDGWKGQLDCYSYSHLLALWDSEEFSERDIQSEMEYQMSNWVHYGPVRGFC